MAHGNNRGNALRITALTAALWGVYGVAGAVPGNTTLVCDADSCIVSGDGPHYSISKGDESDSYVWAVSAKLNPNVVVDKDVDANGYRARGVLATNGARVKLEAVEVSTSGRQGVAVQANREDAAHQSPFIEVAGGKINASGEDGWGLYALRGAQIVSSADIATTGDKGYGVFVESNLDRVDDLAGNFGNGKIILNGGSITTGVAKSPDKGVLSHAVISKHVSNSVIINGTPITTHGNYASGLLAEDGGSIEAAGAIITVNGAGTAKEGEAKTYTAAVHATRASGKGTSTKGVQSHIDLKQGEVHSNGANQTRALLASPGGKITTSGTKVYTVGVDAKGAQAAGEVGSASFAAGVSPEIIISGGQVSTEGKDSYGLHALRGGRIESSADIETKGQWGFGAFAEIGAEIALTGGSITTRGASGTPSSGPAFGTFGVLSKSGSTVTLTNVRVDTYGDLAEGLRAEYEESGAPTDARIVATNTDVTTRGSNAHGVSARGVRSSVTMTGGSITTAGADSAGAFLRNRADITLNDVMVASTGPSLISSFGKEGVDQGAWQKITIGDGSNLSINNGTLLLVKREAGADKGAVTLQLNSGSFASGNIVNVDGNDKLVDVDPSTQTILDIRPGAYWAGVVVSTKDKVVEEGASETYGNVDGNVVPATNSTVTFTPGAQVNGSVSAAQGSTTTFTGDSSITGSVASQGGTMVFGGNTNIGSSVTATQGSSFSFGGTTQIGQPGSTGTALAGQNASFGFSRTAPTTIHGNVVLTQGSSISGGSSGAPVQITGDTSVNDGALLGGNLIIAGQLNAQGGVVSPGNSIGTVRVGSVAAFPSTYEVEVNGAGASDLMIVDSGNVDLSATALTVGQENGNGGYVLNHDYTIIQMPGNTASTEFKSAALNDSFANTLVNLDPVKYSQKDVKISLSVDTSKVAAKRSGLTANQNATLDGVISVAGRNGSADAALLSADTGGALNQLSGELHASTQSALLNSSSLLTTTIAKRMRGNVGAGMMAGAPVAQSSGAMPAGAMPSSAAYPLWAQVVGNWSSLDGDNNAAKVKSDTAGLFIGGDVGVGQGWRLGATLGFTDGKIKVDDRSSRSDVRSYTAAIYGGNSWATAKGSVNFLAGAGYTRHDIDSRRTVSIGGNQTLKADYKANTTHLFTELGYAMPVGKASVVEPYLGLAWISQRAKGFDESGGSAALHGQSQTDNVTTFTLGARGKTTVEAGRHEVRLSAGAGWRHAAGDVEASRKMSFIQGNGATFQVAGAPIAKNAAVVDLGAEMTVGKNAAMGLSYNGQFGNGNTDSTGSLYLKVRFK
ncbi:autotransporter domain-containing protein [Parapusillimonas sp. SGNA-6]|nr:autotransporter domain-containing protein [Parapusillimonas sp. SGNA-6]